MSIGSYDTNNLNLEANETEEQQYILGYLPEDFQWSYAIGTVYKRFWQKGYDTWVLSRNYLHNESLKYQDNIKEDQYLNLEYNSDEIENKFRYENTSTYTGGLRVNYGANLEYAKFYARNFEKTFALGEPVTFNNEAAFDMFSWGLFGQVSKDMLADRLVLSFGLWANANNFNDDMQNIINQLSPRLSASFLLTDGWYLNFNTGRFYQMPPYTSMGYESPEGEMVNKSRIKYVRVGPHSSRHRVVAQCQIKV